MNVMLFTLPVVFRDGGVVRVCAAFRAALAGVRDLSLLVGGTYFFGRAVRALREGALHIDLPIAIGIVGAYLGLALRLGRGRGALRLLRFRLGFILLMLIGRWAQVAAVERNQRRLLKQQPAARRIRLAEGGEVAARSSWSARSAS